MKKLTALGLALTISCGIGVTHAQEKLDPVSFFSSFAGLSPQSSFDELKKSCQDQLDLIQDIPSKQKPRGQDDQVASSEEPVFMDEETRNKNRLAELQKIIECAGSLSKELWEDGFADPDGVIFRRDCAFTLGMFVVERAMNASEERLNSHKRFCETLAKSKDTSLSNYLIPS
jgi:hypothetical protein